MIEPSASSSVPRVPSFDALLDAIAAKTPTPGGGAVAAMTAQLGAALAQMVVHYSIGRKDLTPHEAALRAAAAKLEQERAAFGTLAEDDARAYAALNEAFRLPKDDPSRAARLAGASRAACEPPMHILRRAVALLEDLERLAPITNRNLRSDWAIAAVLLDAAARSAAWNVRVNLPFVEPGAAGELRHEMARLGDAARARCEAIERACA